MRTHGLRFSVNRSILFTELPLLRRPTAAKAAGFDAVEFWWPSEDMVPSDTGADSFAAALGDAGVRLVSLNFHAGDMAAGDRGLVSIPSAAAAFRENVTACAEIAGRTGCRLLNAPYGNRVDGVDPAWQDEVAIENLTIADPPARGAPGTGTLDFEPLFAQLAAQGYAGSAGLEYVPLDPADSSTSFGWL